MRPSLWARFSHILIISDTCDTIILFLYICLETRLTTEGGEEEILGSTKERLLSHVISTTEGGSSRKHKEVTLQPSTLQKTEV